MSAKTYRMVIELSNALERLERLFTGDVKLTFIARFEDNEECDVFVSADDATKVLALVERTIARDRAGRPSIAFPTDEARHRATPTQDGRA